MNNLPFSGSVHMSASMLHRATSNWQTKWEAIANKISDT
jgi:hypothetical protein